MPNNTDNDFFIMEKKVDPSVLRDGFAIPLEFHPILDRAIGHHLAIGEKLNIKLLVGDKFYDARLINQPFSRIKFSHTEIIQIRYSSGSEFSKAMRLIFNVSNTYFEEEKLKPENKGKRIKLSDDINEYFTLCATSSPDVFAIDCFADNENKAIKEDAQKLKEEEFELITDNTAHVTTTYGIKHVRKLDQRIVNSLKILYDNRCQVTG